MRALAPHSSEGSHICIASPHHTSLGIRDETIDLVVEVGEGDVKRQVEELQARRTRLAAHRPRLSLACL